MSERCLLRVEGYGNWSAGFSAFFINLLICSVFSSIVGFFASTLPGGRGVAESFALGFAVSSVLYIFISFLFFGDKDKHCYWDVVPHFPFFKSSCPDVFVYYDDNLIASGKANFFFFVSLPRSGAVYTVKFGDNSVDVTLEPDTHVGIRMTDFGWRSVNYVR